MTVSSTTNSVTRQGNGATTVFPFDFKVLAETDLIVKRQDAASQVVLQTYTPGEYSVAGVGDDAGGFVTLAGAALSSAYNVIIDRVLPVDQPLDLVNQGGFYPAEVERQFDRVAMQMQQVGATSRRALLAPIGEEGGVLPSAPARAGKFLAFGPSGELLPSVGLGSDSNLRTDIASSVGASMIGYRRPEAPVVLRLLSSRLDEVVYAKDYGCTGNYADDVVGNLNDAVNYMPSGGTLDFSMGQFDAEDDRAGVFRLASQWTIDKPISLRGQGPKTTFLIGTMVNNTQDLIHFDCPEEANGLRVEGIRGYFNGAFGRHALYIGSQEDPGGGQPFGYLLGPGKYARLDWLIQNNFFQGGPLGYGLVMDHHSYFASIMHNLLAGTYVGAVQAGLSSGGGLLLRSADGNRVHYNRLTGTGVGARVQLINGAYGTSFMHNAITARNGGMWIDAVQQLAIMHNQFEQPLGASDGMGGYLPNLNQSTYGAHLTMVGGHYTTGDPTLEDIRSVKVWDNNFGRGDNAMTAIVAAGGVRGLDIDYNTFGRPGANDSGADVFLLSANVVGARIGGHNEGWGERGVTPRGTANTLDPKRLVIVDDSGTGTRGFAGRNVPTLGANWTGASFETWVDDNDKLQLEGEIAVNGTAGAVDPAFVIFTLPIGNRPTATRRVPVLTSAGMAQLTINTSGVVNPGTGIVISSTVYLSTIPPVPVQSRPSYLSGPF